jgi:acetyl esterase/lipase
MPRLQPDLAEFLERFESLGLPRYETLTPTEARALSLALAEERAPGPDVGEIVDGTLPGAAGDLDYRLYRPSTPGPHPIVVYYHGGGWVLGSAMSDDPFCRDLCRRSGAMIISVDYRHAPEARFPAAVDDALAALRWVGEHNDELGGSSVAPTVAGWSAGGNLAAVVCRLARDQGGPTIRAQVLITPATDGAGVHASRIENAEGYVLTDPMIRWFWDQYADLDDRADPRASPMLASDLSGLPPALVVTCDFDPLRDEGVAYVDALRSAGVDVRHVVGVGQSHTSIHAIGVIDSAEPIRAEVGEWVARLPGGRRGD